MRWTEYEISQLRRLYPIKSNAELARQLHRTANAVRVKGLKMGLRKTPETVAANRLIPTTKGLKLTNGKKLSEYWKGVDRYPVGSEHLMMRGGRKLWYIKLEKGKLSVAKHRWLWEQAHGPIPKGWVVVFKDGDTTNCTLENLECVPRGYTFKKWRETSSEEVLQAHAKNVGLSKSKNTARRKLLEKWGIEFNNFD